MEGRDFAADQEAVPDRLDPAGRGNFVQVAGRVSTWPPLDCPATCCASRLSSGTWDLRAKLNGATSVSLATFAAPLNAGEAVALQLVGPTLNAYRRTAAGTGPASAPSATRR